MGSVLSLFLAIVFFSIPAFADSPEDLITKSVQVRLWENPQWMNLVHYEKNRFSGFHSQADGPSFFLSPEGASNPEAELKATISLFFREPTSAERRKPKELSDPEVQVALKKTMDDYDRSREGRPISSDERDRQFEEFKKKHLQSISDHPICQFPARLRFIKRELHWNGSGLPKIECYRLNDFRNRVDAKSASLVFSSFFLNNPSSTFGHSFLRLNSGLWAPYRNGRNELLDTGVNFAANVNAANPILYALFGLAGLMPGTFTTVPYYLKVREYNDYESRDLWSYDLDLTSEEMEMLVDHIWEEVSTFYYYKYFTENCSYHMFTLLDAAAPRLGLTNRLPFYVIPSDTIRVLYATPGAVRRVTYRPSVRSLFLHRLKTLLPEEKKALDHLIEGRDPHQIDSNLSKESTARILDAYSDQIELTQAKELLQEGSESQKLKQAVLIQRAALGIRSLNLDVPAPERSAPHLGHGMRRVSLGSSTESDRGPGMTLGYRFAMHDLLDPGLGYARNMEIDMFGIWARYLGRPNGFRNRFEIDEINIFKITALTPVSHYYTAKSIRAEFGLKKTYDRDCENRDHRCLPLVLDYGPGLTLDPTGTEVVSLFGFFQGRFTYSPNYQGSNFRVGVGPRLGAVIYITDSLRFSVYGEAFTRAFSEDDFVFDAEAALRFGLMRDFALDIKGRRERDIGEGLAQVHFYY